MKKKDWYLIAGLLLIAGILFLIMGMGRQAEGKEIRITVDGETIGTYSLTENQEIPVHGELGENLIHIEDGKVWMEEADCPDGYCMEQGKISREKQTIVCLPHKLVVEVLAGENALNEDADDAVDVIAK